MKFIIHSLIFSLLIQVLTPFVVAAAVLPNSHEGEFLVCTQDGYQWVDLNTQPESESSGKGNKTKSIPRCPLCLSGLSQITHILNLNLDRSMKFFSPKLCYVKSVEKYSTTCYINNFLISRILGRAPPLV